MPGHDLPRLAVLALVVACSSRAPPEVAHAIPEVDASEVSSTPASADASAVAASPSPGPEPTTDAGEAPAITPVSAVVSWVGGREFPLPRDGTAVVDPTASFQVEVSAHLTDGRLALDDEQDVMVASSGTSEVGTGFTRYRLVPDEPLRPGTTYLLRIDGSAGREVHDPLGHAYAPVEIRLRTTGERPAPPPRRSAKKKRARPHGRPKSTGPLQTTDDG